jgi:hypothetical protein
MSKKVAFIALLLLAVVFFVAGYYLQEDFLSDLWSQLLFLVLAALITTFVLEAILRRDAQQRGRAKDAFAFRTFSANILNALQAVVELKQTSEKVFEAALSGNKQFATAAAEVAAQIELSPGFDPDAYERYSLDIASGLRDFSRGYIRLFTTNRQDMLTQYRDLNELANRWSYMDELSERARKHTATLTPEDPDKLLREAAFRAQVASARDAAVLTAKKVAVLAAKVAEGKGFYD